MLADDPDDAGPAPASPDLFLGARDPFFSGAELHEDALGEDALASGEESRAARTPPPDTMGPSVLLNYPFDPPTPSGSPETTRSISPPVDFLEDPAEAMNVAGGERRGLREQDILDATSECLLVSFHLSSQIPQGALFLPLHPPSQAKRRAACILFSKAPFLTLAPSSRPRMTLLLS